ncbi:hypothetical protein L2U69_15005 [Zavarzinia compransoris]|uniref:hypothetical protein n=1 Tax=Zavarzinia marina TaxID=2911065 RepID=UPI001F2D6D9C|nr:hypothetical protein [Zavarzinia marina]MCF4166960.1 hypothetical protein [Zavarzinia marina]
MSRRGGRARAAAVALIAGLAAAPGRPAQAAWTGEPGRGQIIVTSTLTRAEDGFDDDGRRRPMAKTHKIEIAPWIEYGVAAGYLAVLQPTWSRLDTDTRYDQGLAKLFLGLRCRLWSKEDEVLSLQPGLTLALGPEGRAARLGSAPDKAELRLLWGDGFEIPHPFGEGAVPAFVATEFAPRLSEDGGVTLLADATLGLKDGKGGMILFQIFNEWTVDAPTGPFRKHQLQPSIVRPLDDGLFLQAGVSWVFAGAATPAETGLIGAVWLRF